MGAERAMWVEVEILSRVWRESYGVTSDEALEHVKLNENERLTGNVRYEQYNDEGYCE